jgi:3-ketosteroid 9alpha-monooxygenase subunit A
MRNEELTCPTGWFAVATTDELANNQVLTTSIWGEEIVLFRDDAGQVAALDAYCRHLGAHLGHGGTVSDGCIVCPFHGWQFAPTGECVGMPYGSKIPPAARVKAFPVAEQDDIILVWYSPTGGAPTWTMPSFSATTWTSTESMQRVLSSHPQETLENTVDLAHFRFIHQSHVTEAVGDPVMSDVTFEMTVRSAPEGVSEAWRLPDAVELEGSTFCHGPGLAGATIGPAGSTLRVLQRLYVTPTQPGTVELRGLVNVEVRSDPAESAAVASFLAPEVFANWDSDIEIWAHKKFLPLPALNSTERAIPVFRRWYSRFYTDGVTVPSTDSSATEVPVSFALS